VTIDRKHAVFIESSLKVQILDAAINLIARQPVFLFELGAIAASDHAADAELNPIFVFFGLLFGRRCGYSFAIARPTANPGGGKCSRKNHYQESARGVCHSIEINI
jgi:hypothetical protein